MRQLTFVLLCTLLLLVHLVTSNKYTDNKCTKDEKTGEEVCEKPSEYDEDDDDEPIFYEVEEKLNGRETLFKWDPVNVGNIREIDLGQGEVVKMKTEAILPTIFTVEDFLTPEECDYIMNRAEQFGLSSSGLHVDDKIKLNKQYTLGHARSAFGQYKQWDLNMDGVITKQEVIKMAQRSLKLYLNETDLDTLFEKLNVREMDDGVITRQEFDGLNTAGIGEAMKDIREEHPRFRDRFSDQIWLKQTATAEPIMKRLRDKVQRLTNLPRWIIEGGEPLQVVRYQPFGHYHAHFDAQSVDDYPDFPCCHLDQESQPFNCRLCRFITVLYYLNDVEEGGETAFPVADMEGYNHEEFKKRKSGDLYNLSEYCHTASVVVKPKRGKAVFWYNHHMDSKGWLGKMDWYSLHGGCDIKKGVKWIANNWIPGPPADVAHMNSLYSSTETHGAH